MAEHLDACVNQEDSKEAKNPFEASDHRCTREDKDASEYQGAEDTPEEHLMLVFALDAEEGEQHQEDEQIVHRQ